MTLENLLGRTLDAVVPSREAVQRLLAAAERNLTDAELSALSAENRFDVAYKAIMQCAMTALHANGYRTLTSRPGHHQTAIQTLPQTIGLANDEMIVLDALRKQRNLADYDGDPVPDATARECLLCARSLLSELRRWLNENRPDLL
ncbi:DNA-binding protein [Trinickia dabaoshanensis]|uniref:DNA-binding protein n=1 Tax=Trinickia dabaoshanensis TaxID=564714 RepID=A0A2N7VZJ4_9BURK|nr:HEPN domain-containing protein [Trinickia dabaoshanensis]PMS22550.1 DNA-binding protein [Trinickia dabaoshanensis]